MACPVHDFRDRLHGMAGVGRIMAWICSIRNRFYHWPAAINYIRNDNRSRSQARIFRRDIPACISDYQSNFYDIRIHPYARMYAVCR